jgi:hypothetical protein
VVPNLIVEEKTESPLAVLAKAGRGRAQAPEAKLAAATCDLSAPLASLDQV